MELTNETHDPSLQSWIESANDARTDFPIQNLPYACFQRQGTTRIGVAIGDMLVDLLILADRDLLPTSAAGACRRESLAELMASPLEVRRGLRRCLSSLLSDAQSPLASRAEVRRDALLRQSEVTLVLPARIGNYTDFYASVYHATNVGSMFRPDNPLLPNYKHIPIGYHGRASSIVVSGHPVVRPCGQLPSNDPQGDPSFGPCRNLDYELEVGVLVGSGNALGHTIPLAEAESHMFGLVLVNDWSARDMQRWEYQPLGPFLAKSFATSISPWVVTTEALAPFRKPAFNRADDDPTPLPYLRDETNDAHGAFDIELTVHMSSSKMRAAQMQPFELSRGDFSQMYWTLAQMIAHHSSNGCNLQTGDLLASGTVSGPQRTSRGCLLELTWDGEYGTPCPGSQRTPITLPTGETRIFLADGDQVILTGRCHRPGFRSIGFGSCEGTIGPARC